MLLDTWKIEVILWQPTVLLPQNDGRVLALDWILIVVSSYWRTGRIGGECILETRFTPLLNPGQQ